MPSVVRLGHVRRWRQHAKRKHRLQRDCVVVSGDLVNHGAAAEYAHLRELLAPLPMRVCLMPGNHDDRAALAAAFAGEAEASPLRQAFTGAPLCCQRVDLAPADGEALTLLLLDTVIPGEEGGEVGAAQIDWRLGAAAERLVESGR